MPISKNAIRFTIDSSLSEIDRRMSIGLKDSLVAIGKSVLNLTTGNVVGMIAEAAEGIRSMTIVGEPTVEALTWMLIRKSLGCTLLELIREFDTSGPTSREADDNKHLAETDFYNELGRHHFKGVKKVAVTETSTSQGPADLRPFLAQIQPSRFEAG